MAILQHTPDYMYNMPNAPEGIFSGSYKTGKPEMVKKGL